MTSVNLQVDRPVFSLPSVLPEGTRCYTLEIPDDPYYAAQLVGLIERAAWWFNYDRDNARTGRLVANLWKKTLASLKECTPPPPPDTGGCDCDCEDCMKYQQVGCLLQVQDCLTGEFVTIFDASACIPNPAPGGGITPPPPAKCQEYQIQFVAEALTVLPFLVNTGDTLTISSAKGAGTDGTPTWFCVDGEVFFGGACVGGAGFNSGDPVPTSPHMCAVVNIGSNYYPFYAGTFTVPSGVTNEQIYVGVNDSSLGDDHGAYTVDFNYCNNQTPPTTTWRAHINFALNSGGFSPIPLSVGAAGAFSAGTGWTGTAATESGGVYVHGVYMRLSLAAATDVTTVEIKGSKVDGSSINLGNTCFLIEDQSGNDLIPTKTFGTFPASPFDMSGAGHTGVTQFNVLLWDYEALTPGGYGSATLTDLFLAGTGTIPPELASFSY